MSCSLIACKLAHLCVLESRIASRMERTGLQKPLLNKCVSLKDCVVVLA